jgi:hypothetical protein
MFRLLFSETALCTDPNAQNKANDLKDKDLKEAMSILRQSKVKGGTGWESCFKPTRTNSNITSFLVLATLNVLVSFRDGQIKPQNANLGIIDFLPSQL